METRSPEDIGEEIISRLKELIAILEAKAKEKENEKELTDTPRH
jgi:hypothetical protein